MGTIKSGRSGGVVPVVAFCVVLAGVNLPNPLVPLYTDRYALTSLAQSVVFSLYLLALVTTLVTVMTRDLNARAPRVLTAALALSVAADLLMALGSGTFGFLLAGRLASGVSVGLATGACATLALAGLGERARTVVASGAVIGSLVGNLGGGLLGSTLPAPAVTVFGLHLLVTVTVLAVHLRTRHASVRTAPDVSTPGLYRARHRRAGLLLGAMAWSAAGVVLALVPATLRGALPSISLLQAVLPVGVFLAAAWAAQTACRRDLLRLRAWQLCIPLVAGLALIATALETADLWLLTVGAIVCGLGQGPAYSLGLATVTHGLRPSHQGRAASGYAAVAYGACGVVTTATGALALASTVGQAVGTLTLALALAALVTAALAGAPQRLPQLARSS
ncbi:MFS transporter [Kineosporia succinea]|uniref:MFS family permease n=1 Tax=Kineosporia succinea TaxID=84632 RepID=A0ABT9PEG6_9ACTN|nr:MFS transporter [Kineosporia succinea]MDP9830881.1 MFS family permease [Kineosporia succinea]